MQEPTRSPSGRRGWGRRRPRLRLPPPVRRPRTSSSPPPLRSSHPEKSRMSHPGAVAAPKTHGAHEAHHEELGFWRKYVFSGDHKVIGIQYAVTGLLFLFFGFSLMMLMRWQLAYPGVAVPLIGGLFGEARMPGGVMNPDFYNELGAMHGTIMVFLGVVPLAVGGFGNFVLPLQIGAPDMAFPKLNM